MNIIFVHTGSGSRYARRLASSVEWIHKHLHRNVTATVLSIADLPSITEAKYAPLNTIIHPRAAYPSETGWMHNLRVLENRGYTVVNRVDTLMITSNKLRCAQLLQDIVPHPRTWEIRDFELPKDLPSGTYVAKPITSMEQGARVVAFDFASPDYCFEPGSNENYSFEEMTEHIGNHVILQEFVPYTALHRVIVIDGKALPYSFVDRLEWHKPGDWKVSCCLNRETMQYNPNPSSELLDIAERAQLAVGGDINFIDMFELDTPDKIVMGEINTACNLRIHERLARAAGQPLWNIHYRIAKYLVDFEKETK